MRIANVKRRFPAVLHPAVCFAGFISLLMGCFHKLLELEMKPCAYVESNNDNERIRYCPPGCAIRETLV